MISALYLLVLCPLLRLLFFPRPSGIVFSNFLSPPRFFFRPRLADDPPFPFSFLDEAADTVHLAAGIVLITFLEIFSGNSSDGAHSG